MLEKLSRDDIRMLLLSGNEDVRKKFVEQFEPGLENFSSLMAKALRQLQSMEDRVPYELRSAWTFQFLYVAFNNVFSAFHLLFAGFLIPSGNLMRQFAEAIALGLLCSHRGIDVFDRVQREMTRFPAHHALKLVNQARNRKLLNVNEEGWRKFNEITRQYDAFSHSSILAVASTHIFSTNGRQLGGEYDPAKFKYYQTEVSLCISGAMRLLDAIAAAETNLNESRLGT